MYGYNRYQLDDCIARVTVQFKSKSCCILGNSQPRVVVLIMECYSFTNKV